VTIPLQIKPADAANWCWCTNYVRNRFGLSNDFPNATDWNDGYLQRNGFVQTSAKPGAIVVMEGSSAFTSDSRGHVGVVESIDSSGRITVRGANQSMGTSPVTESDCTNVRSTPFGTSINGRSDISFWEKVNNATGIMWQQLSGSAKDIGIGANGTVWVIGTNPVSGGYGIYKWNGSGWQGIDGGALRIAVDPSGNPWVVNSSGNIFRRTPNGWQMLSGLAKDIGIGADGTVWIIGANPVSGGYGIYKWNGSGWQGIDGGALRIAVDKSGTPWVVNSSGNIFRRTPNGWQMLSGLAKDIGIGADGTVWVIGTIPVAGGYGIYKWNGNGWQGFSGGAENISVDSSGNPWVVNNVGSIFKGKL
jgi:surface antigen